VIVCGPVLTECLRFQRLGAELQAEQDAAQAAAESALRQPPPKKSSERKNFTAKKNESPKKTPGSLDKLSTKKLEQRIETIELRIAEIDQAMMDPDVYSNGKKSKTLQKERTALGEELEPLEFEWARRAEEE